MKAVIFIQVLYLILIRTFMVKGATKCESKVELRAVLLSCPPKDSGCDDDDPLSLAMKAEEAQILQANSKNFESLKQEKEKGFPNAVKDCKRKLIITLKVKNVGKIPCDDEYIVVDHVFDPVTGGRGRLLSPVVLKLRQEQMIQLYGLQFQRVVNSDPFEEQKAADKTCSVDPENPSCGIAMYDGKPIPYSEGFCCSCDPHVNAKRQLSPVGHGDSFLYRDSKLISQGNRRLIRSEEKGSAIVKPELVRLRGGSDGRGESSAEKGGDCGGIAEPQSWDKLPNFLLEHDRKIVCDRGDFMNELCRLREERNKAGSDVREKKFREEEGRLGVGRMEEVVLEKAEMTTVRGKTGLVEGGRDDAEREVKNLLVLQGFMKALNEEQRGLGERMSEKYEEVKGSRGKRENRKESKKVSLEEKLERFVSGKKNLRKRRKRLLELSRKRFRKAGEQCGMGQECQTMTATDYMQDDYVRSPPPKYFFSHDRFIVDPLESPEAAMNSTCRTTEEMGYEENGSEKEKKYQHAAKNSVYKAGLGEKGEKMLEPGFYDEVGDGKGQGGKMKVKEKYLVGKIGSKKERVSHNEGGRIENSMGRSKAKVVQGLEGPSRQTVSLRGEKRFSVYRGSQGEKGESEKGEGEKGAKGLKEEEEEAGMLGDEYFKPQKSRFHGKNLKGFLHKNSYDKKLVKPRIRNFFMARNRERQKLRSELVKSPKKLEGGYQDKESFEGKNFRELLKENAKRIENQQNADQKMGENMEEKMRQEPHEGGPERAEMSESPHNSEKPEPLEITESPAFPDTSEKPAIFGVTTNKFDLGRLEYPHDDKAPQEQHPHTPPNKYIQNLPQLHPGTSRNNDARPRTPSDLTPHMDFNVEIIRNTYPEVSKHRHHAASSDQHLKSRLKVPAEPHESKLFDVYGKPGPLKTRLNLYYKPPERYYIIENDQFQPQDVYLIQGSSSPFGEAKSRQYYVKEPGVGGVESPRLSGRPEASYNPMYYKKPTRRYYVPIVEYAEKESGLRQREVLSGDEEGKVQEGRGKRYSESMRRRLGEAVEGTEGGWGAPGVGKVRGKRSVGYSFEPARGFLRSEFGSEGGGRGDGEEVVHELEGCVGRENVKKGEAGERWRNEVGGWEIPRGKRVGNVSVEAKMISSLEEVERRLNYPVFGWRETGKREQKTRRATDKERLVQSYLNAPEYVLEEVEAVLKGKRQAVEQNKPDNSRGSQTCEKDTFAGEYTQDTAHCMRFGDMWYSLYSIKRPVVAQIVGVQLFDKHSQCDGTTQWRELTKGKMIRIGTFLPKAEDELPSVSMTFIGGKTKKIESAIDPENYLLLIPSHVSDPSKANSYPQFEAGPEEYLVVQAKDVSLGGECNMIGTSFEAFARQPDRCAQRRGSCLKRQPVDLWREDMEARIRGKRGKYFVENFGSVPNSPVKTYTNLTGEFLALEYYGEYTSVIEIEVKADANAIIRKGSNAQISLVYIDNTYPKKTRIMLSVLNIGLTASYFRPRLGDCPPDLDPAWCPLEGPLVIIPPQQRHDFKLDLSGALPSTQIFMTVQVLNQLNKKIAQRKILIKKGDRCVCAFHCKCNCVGNLVSGKTCRKLNLEEYRKAGYIGQYPFRGGAATSASESILGNIHIVFLTASYVLLFLGVMKGVLGVFFRRIGIAGIRVITGPRQLSQYYESELECCSVLFDDFGFPVHPTTCQPVQIVPLWLETIINFLFFFLYPLRGIWFLLLSLPCCKAFCIECEVSPNQDEGADSDHKCSSPLLSKQPQPTCVHYNLTTINTKKSKQDEYLPYLPYKGDDDPLEEDDTEFVLQEMKRYRKK